MKNELKNNLLEYLGELMCESERTFEWREKDAITRKINAVNSLLGYTENKKTTFEMITDSYMKKHHPNFNTND